LRKLYVDCEAKLGYLNDVFVIPTPKLPQGGVWRGCIIHVWMLSRGKGYFGLIPSKSQVVAAFRRYILRSCINVKPIPIKILTTDSQFVPKNYHDQKIS